MTLPLDIRVQDIDHCGIVAGICDEMNLVEQIDRLLGTHPQEIISAGQVVKAMILNGLGFVSAPLYLFEKFFVGKATEHLLGEGIRPEHLNDDRLGRVLDKLYETGLTEVFVTVALCAARKFGVKMDSRHLDSSSFHVDGDYINNGKANIAEPGGIEITYGYSRDHRRDLKQFILDLMCSGDGDIPLYLRIGDGNESDSAMMMFYVNTKHNSLLSEISGFSKIRCFLLQASSSTQLNELPHWQWLWVYVCLFIV